MRVSIVTDNKACVNAFILLGRSRNHSVESRPLSDLRTVIADNARDHFVYLDITGLSKAAVRSRARQLQEALGRRFGFIDRDGAVDDVAEVFQRGASDYVCGRLLRAGMTTARFTRIAKYAETNQPATEDDIDSDSTIELSQIVPSGRRWDDVEPGQEYTFQMLYVGLDYMKEMRRKSSEDLLRAVRKSLQGILTRSFAGAGGRIWVWKEDDGVLLCPFDGERITALVPAMRLVLNRAIMNIEHFSVTTPISWRMGLHVGETQYEASGSTSAIVSQSLNFIFHLGERALKPGQLAVTAPALNLAPEKIRQCFTRDSVFESTPLYLMRDLL